MKINNKGLSLIEVVIVITILAVLGSIMTLGVTAAVSKPADECANKIVSSLNGGRITNMGKQSETLRYYESDGKIYLNEIYTATQPGAGGATQAKNTTTQIGAKGVVVTYKLEGDSSYHTLDGTGIVLQFNRSTGGFYPEINSGKYIEEIVVTKGTKVKTIKLYYLTGKVVLE